MVIFWLLLSPEFDEGFRFLLMLVCFVFIVMSVGANIRRTACKYDRTAIAKVL